MYFEVLPDSHALDSTPNRNLNGLNRKQDWDWLERNHPGLSVRDNRVRRSRRNGC